MATDRSKQPMPKNQAEVYNKRSADLQIPDGLKFMNHLSLIKGSKVLDLGCGTGNLTAVLADRVGSNGQVIGVDPDTERIKVARDKNARDNLSFMEASGESLPEDQYDLVFSSYVLHWIENKDAVFKSVSKNLQPGGQFVFTIVLEMPPLVAEMIKLMEPAKQKAMEKKRYFVTVEKLEELAIANGFMVTLKQLDVSRHTLPSIDSALEFVFASSNGDFDPALANQVALEELKEKYRQQPVEFTEHYACFILTKQ